MNNQLYFLGYMSTDSELPRDAMAILGIIELPYPWDEEALAGQLLGGGRLD